MKTGDRVRLTPEAAKIIGKPRKPYTVGTLVGRPTGGFREFCWRIKWDGRGKQVEVWSEVYLVGEKP